MSAGTAALPRQRATIPNPVIGTLIFLATEAMFFAGLISACLVLRSESVVWPPPDQPRLPTVITLGNLLLLLASGWSMWRAVAAERAARRSEIKRWLLAAALLGVVFLAIQGSEWMQLVRFGLSRGGEVYGGVFYTIIGAHGLHVLGGVVVLLAALRQVTRRHDKSQDLALLEACRLYWTFVVGLWPLLYVLVYLL